MIIIKTKSGSEYFIDTINKTVSGGKLRKTVSYTKCSALVGESGVFYLSDGRILQTSTITAYLRA